MLTWILVAVIAVLLLIIGFLVMLAWQSAKTTVFIFDVLNELFNRR